MADKDINQENKTDIVKSDTALREEKILAFWKENNIFEKTLTKPAPNGNFVTYDGPPFATGLPHFGHFLPGTIKDIMPRYETMKGKRVLRRWGWDCHGLPVENLVEKELGLKSKKDIEAFGVENFNQAARNSVFRYADEWKRIIPRMGRWVDMDHDYRTMDTTYTESVWWSFKKLYDKGLVYQGFRSMLFCPHDETTLSNFEVNLGYKDITDITVYVKFKLVDENKPTYIVAWTTTPWTLPGNVAVAVNKDFQYIKIEEGELVGESKTEYYIIAKETFEKNKKFFKNPKIVEEFSGEKLLEKTYVPVFDYYATDLNLDNKENGWKIYHGDFVTMDSGTGVVHIASAFGEDDMNLGKSENLPFIQHVERDGTFKKEVVDFSGTKVKPIEDPQQADIEVIKYLAKRGTLFAKEKIVHAYPHCWRCGTPLLNYATTSWFVKVTDIKERMIEINNTISWTPKEIGEGRFGKWLEGARDWNISRSRYWGAPLPVWMSIDGKMEIIGSVADLKAKTKKSGNKYVGLRHGEAEHNILGIWSSGNRDVHHLTAHGKDQVKKTTEEIREKFEKKEFDYIFVSPFLRTRETAEIIAEGLGIERERIVCDERLSEWNVGVFDGKPMSDYFSLRHDSGNPYEFESVNGESYRALVKRAGDFMYDLEKKYQHKNILIVSHGAVLRALSLLSEGISVENEAVLRHRFENYGYAEMREITFVPLPHNQYFEIDLHRPYIDDVQLFNELGQLLSRVPEVFDTWYDSGSMPFAQQHYPFEHKEEFEKSGSALFPADFIAEGLDQTRGWFYTLLVLSVALFDRAPYERVLVNGLVLAEDGRKMSKSLKNYPDVMETINKFGADALRYYLIASPLVKAEDFNFSEKGVDEIHKKIVQKLGNVLSFYETYASEPSDNRYEGKRHVLDSWILSRLVELRDVVTVSLDAYELDRASRPIIDFVDDLSTWYVRRSRDRLKSENKNEQTIASAHLAIVLLELSKIIAPFMPFLAEEIYQKLRHVEGAHAEESVHLTKWPKYTMDEEGGDENRLMSIDLEGIESMKRVREVVSRALELRQKAGMKVRQPLASLTIEINFSPELLDIIADEINVKKVIVSEGSEMSFDTVLTDELLEEGVVREIIRGIQDVRKKENLDPTVKIKIIVCIDERIKKIFEKSSSAILGVTLVGEIVYSLEKQVHHIVVDGSTFSVSVVR